MQRVTAVIFTSDGRHLASMARGPTIASGIDRPPGSPTWLQVIDTWSSAECGVSAMLIPTIFPSSTSRARSRGDGERHLSNGDRSDWGTFVRRRGDESSNHSVAYGSGFNQIGSWRLGDIGESKLSMWSTATNMTSVIYSASGGLAVITTQPNNASTQNRNPVIGNLTGLPGYDDQGDRACVPCRVAGFIPVSPSPRLPVSRLPVTPSPCRLHPRVCVQPDPRHWLPRNTPADPDSNPAGAAGGGDNRQEAGWWLLLTIVLVLGATAAALVGYHRWSNSKRFQSHEQLDPAASTAMVSNPVYGQLNNNNTSRQPDTAAVYSALVERGPSAPSAGGGAAVDAYGIFAPPTGPHHRRAGRPSTIASTSGTAALALLRRPCTTMHTSRPATATPTTSVPHFTKMKFRRSLAMAVARRSSTQSPTTPTPTTQTPRGSGCLQCTNQLMVGLATVAARLLSTRSSRTARPPRRRPGCSALSPAPPPRVDTESLSTAEPDTSTGNAASITRLGVLKVGSCEGGALPVITSIIGPRETHDYRD